MARKPPSDFPEIVAMLIRRKAWIITCLLVVPPLVYLAGRELPKKYRSETVILVDPQRVPEDYVKAITGDATDRLQTISEEVMSRTRLLMIANKDGLYQGLREKYGDDSAIDSMRKDITVDVIKGANDRSPIEGFKIAYTAPTPQVAQKVTQQIADLFIAENIKERDQDAEGTEAFIENQLVKARANLAAQDEKIRNFKASHLGTLPEQEAANLSMISQYESLAQENSGAIDRANQQQVYLESMLNVNGATKEAAGAPPAYTPLQLRLQAAENELSAARQKYTDSHPDVIRLRDEVATLKAEVGHQPANAPRAASLSGPTMDQQLQSQLLATQQEIKSRNKRQQELEKAIGALQGKVQSLPAVQQEYESLSRDYSEMQKNYESLLQKEQASGMAAELERHNESERFRVLDPASYPTSPYWPNLLLIKAGGLFGALLLGLGLAFLAEMRDPTIHNADEAESYLTVPLIVALPSLRLSKEMSRRAPRTSMPLLSLIERNLGPESQ